MNDTHKEIEELYTKLLMERTPEERLKMGCSMFETAKRIAINSIFNNNPEISSKMAKQELFLRFYGAEFNSEQKRRILNSL
ncbi:MAG: hypothetical protein AB1633_11215 [Elusimicrobiota bacterium]